MTDETWRALLRIAILAAMVAVAIGVPALCFLAYRIHAEQHRLLNAMLIWAKDVEPSPPPDDPPVMMGSDGGLTVLWLQIKRLWHRAHGDVW